MGFTLQVKVNEMNLKKIKKELDFFTIASAASIVIATYMLFDFYLDTDLSKISIEIWKISALNFVFLGVVFIFTVSELKKVERMILRKKRWMK